jgi:hypothetical protein
MVGLPVWPLHGYVAGLLSWPVRKNLGCLVPVALHIPDTIGFLGPIALDR